MAMMSGTMPSRGISCGQEPCSSDPCAGLTLTLTLTLIQEVFEDSDDELSEDDDETAETSATGGGLFG